MNKKMMKAVAALMLMMAVVFAAGCTKTDDSNNNNGGNTNTPGALANTSWQLNVENDETYHTTVVYSVVFGPNDEIVFTRIINGVGTYQMSGTYTYTNGQGKAVMHNVGETVDYNFSFTVDGNTMVFHYNLRDITLTKIA
ncbi:MAG: hypothetical protein IKH44_00880 [Bacteroidales bacterium]|nr:hypothetical protein [Bacteroidales bacterium]